MKTNKKGFTLIEIMVVTVIAVILVAVLAFWAVVAVFGVKLINKVPDPKPAIEQPVDQTQE